MSGNVKESLAAFSPKDLQVALNVWITLRQQGFGMSRLYTAMWGQEAPSALGQGELKKRFSKGELRTRKQVRQARFAQTKWGWQRG
jgi:hypothetical protein